MEMDRRVGSESTQRLKNKDIVGKVCIGRHGLGFGEAEMHQRWETAGDKEKRKMVGSKLRKVEEKEKMTRAVEMPLQGAWVKWESAVKRRKTWKKLQKMEPTKTSL